MKYYRNVKRKKSQFYILNTPVRPLSSRNLLIILLEFYVLYVNIIYK